MNFYEMTKKESVKSNLTSDAQLGRAIKRAVYEGLEVKGKPKVNQDFNPDMTNVIKAMKGEKVNEKDAALILKQAGYTDKEIKQLLEITCK